jgi:hypothetical protein
LVDGYYPRMQPQQAAIWGALGSIAIEAYELFVALRVNHHWPWRPPNRKVAKSAAFGAWVTSALARLVVGTITAAASSSQLAGDLTAFGIGAAGTLVLERIISSVTTSTALEQPPLSPRDQRSDALAAPSTVVGQAADGS